MDIILEMAVTRNCRGGFNKAELLVTIQVLWISTYISVYV
jgi:hypothetical protein